MVRKGNYLQRVHRTKSAVIPLHQWNPQSMNDIDMLYEEYGRDLILGVMPPQVEPEASEEEVCASLEGLIEKYCHPDAHPVTVFSMGGHPKQSEAIYKLSRIALEK